MDINSDEVDQIRARLVSISDELRTLAADDFAAKHQLNVEADELRRQLGQFSDGDSEIQRRWADRSARKGSHTTDDSVEAAKAAIVSPGEGGGEGGGGMGC